MDPRQESKAKLSFKGKKLFREAKRDAKNRNIDFGWTLKIVPRVGHDNRLIAPHARNFLFHDK